MRSGDALGLARRHGDVSSTGGVGQVWLAVTQGHSIHILLFYLCVFEATRLFPLVVYFGLWDDCDMLDIRLHSRQILVSGHRDLRFPFRRNGGE